MTNNRDMNKSSELTSTHSADLNMVARVDNEPVEPNQAEQALIEDEAEEVDDQVIEQEEAEADAMQENDDGESVNPPTEVQGEKPRVKDSEQLRIEEALKDFSIPKKRGFVETGSSSSGSDSVNHSDLYSSNKRRKAGREKKTDKPNLKLCNKLSSQMTFYKSKKDGPIDEWLGRMEFIVRPYDLSDAEMRVLVTSKLDGKAFETILDADCRTYNEMKDVLLVRFRTPGAYYATMQRVLHSKRRETDPVETFYGYLQSESQKAKKIAVQRYGRDIVLFSDDVLISTFISGINNDYLQEQLLRDTYRTLFEVYEAACVIENSLKKKGNRVKTNQGTGKVKCFNCKEFGHKSFECKKPKVNSITLTNNVVTLKKHDKEASVLAKVGLVNAKVQIDSGADVNCISSELLVRAGYTVVNPVRGPAVTFAGNGEGRAIGQAEIRLKFHKDDEGTLMKFLVLKNLTPSCIIGVDGQDQLRVRLDWEQGMMWIKGHPIPLGQSEAEAMVNLGSMSLLSAFKEKFKDKLEHPDSVVTDHYTPVNTDDLVLDDDVMSIDMDDSTWTDVQIADNITPADKSKVRCLLSKFKDCFGFFEKTRGLISSVTSKVAHKINHNGSIHKRKAYRASPAQLQVIRDEVKTMLDLGIIRRSKSEYASGVVLVPKPDGSWRFCVDYRELNKNTKSDCYPIPNIQDCLSKLEGAKCFAKIDLAAGYWQIAMDEKDVEKTAFITQDGLYEFTTMPFGLKTAPATFQRMMDEVLGNILHEFAIVYLDDILIFASSMDELVERVQIVFERLAAVNLKMRAKKCYIGHNTIEYLGYIVSDKGIHADDKKVNAINSYRAPTTLRQLRRFLGMCSYYRNFIPMFSDTAQPLNRLTKKGQAFQWGEEQQVAFETLKRTLCDKVVLDHPNYELPFVIFTDASKYGVGAVLTQNGRPLWFASRSLTDTEQNYDVREQEAIAVLFGLEKFKPYFFGMPVTVLTDHGNLRWLMDHRQSGRLSRWQMFLQQFDLTIKYVPGDRNPVADTLSRDIDDTIRINAMTLRSQKHRTESVKRQEISQEIKKHKFIEVLIPTKKKYKEVLYNKEFNWHQEQLNDPYCKRQVRLKSKGFVIVDNVLYRQTNNSNNLKMVVPEDMVDSVIAQAHDNCVAGHGGVKKTCYNLRKLWFPSFRSRVEHHCKRCAVCVKAKGFTERYSELSTRPPAELFNRVYMDVVGPLPNDTDSYRNDARYILTMMDDNSRFLVAKAMFNCKRRSIIEAFRDMWIGVFGPPKEVVTDNNEQFKGKFVAFCKQYQTNNVYTAPYSPEMNAVERSHKTLMGRIRATRFDTNKPWTECLHTAVLGYNVSIHDQTQVPPYTMVFSREFDVVDWSSRLVNNIGNIRAEAVSRAFNSRKRALDKINRTRKNQVLKVGDKVQIKDHTKRKLDSRVREEMYLVLEFESTNIVKLKSPSGITLRRSRKDIYKSTSEL